MTGSSPKPEAYRAVGRLVFAAEPGAAGGRPLHHVQIELWARKLVFEGRVGGGVTGADGRFDIPLDGHSDDVKFSLRVFDSDRRYDDDGSPRDVPREVHRATVDLEATGGVFEIGDVAVPFWPYRDDWPVARAGDMNGRAPQEYSEGQKRALDHSKLFAFGPLYVKHVLLDPLRSDARDLKEIQADYPPNLTMSQPEASRTDAWIGDRVLNGHNLAQLGRDAHDPKLYRIKYAWGDVAPDGKHDLCDVDSSFQLDGGALLPVRITLALRTPERWDPPQVLTFRPGDPQWAAAKRVFRVHYLLHGEVYAHLTRAHFLVEQYVIAAFRNLRLSPIRSLLAPHLQEVTLTNREGDDVAWGPSAILAWGTALQSDGLVKRIVEDLAGLDWTGWRPRRPLCDAHVYARAAGLCWDVLTEYVDHFFAENAADIERHWVEVRRFSDDLVAHSPAYRPPAQDADIDRDDPSELDDPAVPRATVGGAVRAVRPITATDGPPGAADLANLKQVCRYVIFHATFYHSWVHDRQYADGGEIAYATPSLRNGSLGAEDDVDIAPTPKEASFGLLTLAVGTATRHGFILNNEDRDQPPALVHLLKRHQAQFEAVGFDVSQIRSRINI